jgi:sRNA-binding protein
MFNVVRTIDFGLYAVKPPATRIDLDGDAAETLRAEFDRYSARPDTHTMTAVARPWRLACSAMAHPRDTLQRHPAGEYACPRLGSCLRA